MTEQQPYIRQRVQSHPKGVSLTEQAHEGSTNINKIISRAKRTGMLPNRGNPGFYGDFTNAVDFHTAQNKIIHAKEQFLTLPAAIRKRFDNDPGELLNFLSDESNIDEAMELGIIPRPAPAQSEGPSEPSEPVEPPVEGGS